MDIPNPGAKLTCVTGKIRTRRSGQKGNKTRWLTIVDISGNKISFKVPDDMDNVDFDDLKEASQKGMCATICYDATHFAYTVEIVDCDAD